MGVYRFGQWKNTLPGPARWVAQKAYRLGFLTMNLTVGCHIPETVQFGDDPHLIHAKDIMMHPKVKFGARVGLMQGVVFATTPDRPGVPEIGDDVLIGVAAVIVGPVKIGDGARIAPNSLVLQDVPAGATAIGVPARIIKPPKDSVSARGKGKSA
jgi:serine O-acetyltransferase